LFDVNQSQDVSKDVITLHSAHLTKIRVSVLGLLHADTDGEANGRSFLTFRSAPMFYE